MCEVKKRTEKEESSDECGQGDHGDALRGSFSELHECDVDDKSEEEHKRCEEGGGLRRGVKSGILEKDDDGDGEKREGDEVAETEPLQRNAFRVGYGLGEGGSERDEQEDQCERHRSRG